MITNSKLKKATSVAVILLLLLPFISNIDLSTLLQSDINANTIYKFRHAKPITVHDVQKYLTYENKTIEDLKQNFDPILQKITDQNLMKYFFYNHKLHCSKEYLHAITHQASDQPNDNFSLEQLQNKLKASNLSTQEYLDNLSCTLLSNAIFSTVDYASQTVVNQLLQYSLQEKNVLLITINLDYHSNDNITYTAEKEIFFDREKNKFLNSESRKVDYCIITSPCDKNIQTKLSDVVKQELELDEILKKMQINAKVLTKQFNKQEIDTDAELKNFKDEIFDSGSNIIVKHIEQSNQLILIKVKDISKPNIPNTNLINKNTLSTYQQYLDCQNNLIKIYNCFLYKLKDTLTADQKYLDSALSQYNLDYKIDKVTFSSEYLKGNEELKLPLEVIKAVLSINQDNKAAAPVINLNQKKAYIPVVTSSQPKEVDLTNPDNNNTVNQLKNVITKQINNNIFTEFIQFLEKQEDMKINFELLNMIKQHLN